MICFNEVLDLKEKKFDIFTIGELLIDMISDDYSDNFQCDNYTKYFGGSPANIKRLGVGSAIASSDG